MAGIGCPAAEGAEVSAWSDTPFTAVVGAAVHYEIGENGDRNTSATTSQTGPYDNFLAWTVDGQIKCHGLGLAGAFYGWHFDAADGNSTGDTNNYAATVQVAYQVIPDKFEPFVEYEWIRVDDAITDDNNLNIVTAGFNYYFKKHNLKITADAVLALNNINTGNTMGIGLTGLGILTDRPGEDHQVAGRIQLQLLF